MIKKVKVFNFTSNNMILDEAEIADSFNLRLKGLLGRSSLAPGKGLIIRPCRSVHTMGMQFPIDIAFVDNEDRICHIIKNMRPYKISPCINKSSYIIEAPSGTFTSTSTAVGDKVKLEGKQKSEA
ncbi:MAG: DUF192 domain-containing protein [Bacillota bacterium]|nr:DUF192 domain-containing protein [Bacillota bacterium]